LQRRNKKREKINELPEKKKEHVRTPKRVMLTEMAHRIYSTL